MKLQKIVAAIAFPYAFTALCAAAPYAANAAVIATNIPTKLPVIAARGQLVAASDPVQPENLSVPSLNDLNQEIDKNDTVIEKKPLPNFKLSPSTKKIIQKLPMTNPRTTAGGSVTVKTADFNGAEEKVPDTASRNTANKPKTAEAPKEANKGKNPVKPGQANQQAAQNNQPNGQPGKPGQPGQPGQPGRPQNPNQRTSNFEIKVSAEAKPVAPDELMMASKAYAVGQYESAIAIYKNVLKEAPDDRDALFGLATSYHRNGQRDQAKIYYAKLLDIYPNDTEGQNNFLSLVGEEAPDDAIAEFTELAKANPDFAPIYAHKAMIYLKQGDDKNAIKNLYQALKMQPDNNDYKYNLAILFDRNGYNENAARLYTDLVQDSYKGIPIPASRNQISERIIFLNSKIKNTN